MTTLSTLRPLVVHRLVAQSHPVVSKHIDYASCRISNESLAYLSCIEYVQNLLNQLCWISVFSFLATVWGREKKKYIRGTRKMQPPSCTTCNLQNFNIAQLGEVKVSFLLQTFEIQTHVHNLNIAIWEQTKCIKCSKAIFNYLRTNLIGQLFDLLIGCRASRVVLLHSARGATAQSVRWRRIGCTRRHLRNCLDCKKNNRKSR